MDLFEITLVVMGILTAIVGLISAGTSIYLSAQYVRFNRKENSAGLTGQAAARRILDNNGLSHIEVCERGVFFFGNGYSHYFKRIRLRSRIRNKSSITSLAMGAQKASLAVLDKEGDPDMQTRIKLIPLINFGPFAFIPLVFVGVLLDVMIFNSTGICTAILCSFSILFYVLSIVLSVYTLKTEKKAQEKAYVLLERNNMATKEEIEDMKALFKLYNIQYINDIILASLELAYRVLKIVIAVKSGKGKLSS